MLCWREYYWMFRKYSNIERLYCLKDKWLSTSCSGSYCKLPSIHRATLSKMHNWFWKLCFKTEIVPQKVPFLWYYSEFSTSSTTLERPLGIVCLFVQKCALFFKNVPSQVSLSSPANCNPAPSTGKITGTIDWVMYYPWTSICWV